MLVIIIKKRQNELRNVKVLPTSIASSSITVAERLLKGIEGDAQLNLCSC